jgi:nicotinamide riboside kinase
MEIKKEPKIVVITGAESTGKTILTQQLADYYKAPFYMEYAREYISGLGRQYTYDDVEIIAKKQAGQYEEALRSNSEIIFFDTWLIITKVWFEVVYKTCPAWVSEKLKSANIYGFILNDLDIPWEPDPVRENGGENRKILHEVYLKNLADFGFRYKINRGLGSNRLDNAIKIIENKFQ